MTQPFVPGYGPSIPAPTPGGVTVQDDQGNSVPAATTITFPDGVVAAGAPGEAVAKPGVEIQDEGVVLPGGFQKIDFSGAGVAVADAGGGRAVVAIPGGGGPANTVQDTFGNVVPGVTLFSFQPPASTFAGAPGEAVIYPFNAPTTPAQDLQASFADGGDIGYSPALKFETVARIPTFTGVGNYPRFDNSLGYTVFRFNPDDAPAGAPWFGSGNGFLWKAQNAAPGSGLAGGDMGLQAGNGRSVGGGGGTAFLQAGGNPDDPAFRGVAEMRHSGGGPASAVVSVGGPLGAALGFFGPPSGVQQTIVGSRGGNAALASLLTALANYGLIIDATTP